MTVSPNDLVACLESTLSPESHIRQHAEAYLYQASKNEGFCVALISILQTPDLALGTRQLAAVILRRHIQTSWSGEEEDGEGYHGFNGRCIGDAEKQRVRFLLPLSLADPNSRIQTAVSMAIAEIGKSDCPNRWPELLPGLAEAIRGGVAVSGALTCLATMMEDLAEMQVIEIAPSIIFNVLNIVKNEQASVLLRRQGLSVWKALLGATEVTYKMVPAAADLLHTSLPHWLNAISSILDLTPTQKQNWALHYDAIACLLRVIQSFSKPAAKALPPVLSRAWGLYLACLPVYEQTDVRPNPDGELSLDEEPDTLSAFLEPVSLSDLVSQLSEALLAVIGSHSMRGFIYPAMSQLAYVAVGYAQMAEDAIERWESDVNAYLGEEEEFWGPRASGELLLDELMEFKGIEALESIAGAIQRRLDEADAARASNDPLWWKLREAALLALGAVANQVKDLLASNSPPSLPNTVNPRVFGPAILSRDLDLKAMTSGFDKGSKSVNKFLTGRAFWVVSRWADALPLDVKSAAIRACCVGLSPGSPAPVQAAACQAFSRLAQHATQQDIQDVSDGAFSGFVALLGQSTEDSLHLVLECAAILVQLDPIAAERWEQHLSPIALKVWAENVNDPLVGDGAERLIRMIAQSPGCLSPLQHRAVPTLCQIIGQGTQQQVPPILVSSAIDLLVYLLQPSPTKDAAKLLVASAVPLALQCLSPCSPATCKDDNIQSSVTALLRTAVQVGGEQSFGWIHSNVHNSPEAGMATIVQVALSLLQSADGVSDVGCGHVGSLLIELLRHGRGLMAPYLDQILIAVAHRLHQAEEPHTVQSLIGFLAFLILTEDVDLIINVLAGNQETPVPTLQLAMDKWTARQMEIRTSYEIRRTLTALGRLLLCPNARMDSTLVKGSRVDTGDGIRTRSRAAKTAETWNYIPLRTKLVIILLDAYIEAATQNFGNGDIQEDEWEEEEEEDDDDGSGDGVDGEVKGGGLWDEYGMLRDPLIGKFDGVALEEEEIVLGNVDVLEAQRRKADPLSSLDLEDFSKHTLQQAAQAFPTVVQAAIAELTPTQMSVAQQIWSNA